MSSEGQCHNDACLWKVDDLSNNVCEYEVNRLPNDNIIRGKRNVNEHCNAGRPHTQSPANRPPNRQDRYTNI